MTEKENSQRGTERVNSFIAKFSAEVSRAIGKEIRFPALNESGVSRLSRGSASIEIHVFEESDEILFLSRIMPVPAQQGEECCRYLLELNFTSTSDGAFAIDRETDTICLRAFRNLAGMDYDEFETILQSVGSVADEWDDRLKERFCRPAE
jgi:hypothetical protein